MTRDEIDSFLYIKHAGDAMSAIVSLTAERDAAYRRGQEEMRNRATAVCREVADGLMSKQGQAASRICAKHVANLPIKEHPDDN